MTTLIYYRRSLMDKEEYEAASKHFLRTSLLTDIKKGDFVIPRYSLFPFAADQLREIESVGARAINDYSQFLYTADLQNWAYDLEGLTPKTWDRLEDLPEIGPFVLKGETNSRKSNWNRDMYATTKVEAIQVHSRLCDDTLIGQQKIYIRQYVPLVSYLTGIGGIPISKEFRFFVAYGQVICGAYYWQNYAADLETIPSVKEVPAKFLQQVIDRIGDRNNFYVMDVAQAQNGEWLVIEINAGEQSGLSCIEPEALYSGLNQVLETR